MTKTKNERIPEAALTGSLREYRLPEGQHLIDRVSDFYKWQNLRREYNVWPYAKSTATAPMPHTSALSDSGQKLEGVNFASQDYLTLSSHPAIKEAALKAVKDFGVHSAGSGALLGNTSGSLKLEAEISDFLDGRATVLYPTGWSAGFASVQGIVRPDDHVVMDVLAHSCLQEGARAATQNVHFHGHLNIRAVERRLQRIRATDTTNGILVITESLFSMHSDTPDIGALRALCDEYNAQLLVDCAHDFGSIGDAGLGHLGLQNMVDAADVIIGSFSKTFASNGGFISVKNIETAEYLKYYSATQTFSNALSPVQAATVLEAFKIVRSDEGKKRRRSLMNNVLYMRAEMEKAGLETLGDPSAIVPVRVGAEGLARIASRNLSDLGAIANLVEYPAVPQGGARFRVQVMSEHTNDDIDRLVVLMLEAMKSAEREYRTYREDENSSIHPTTIPVNAAATRAA